METIKRAVWRDSNAESEEEPVSGEQGTGTPSHPYDKGNQELQQEEDAKNASAARSASNIASSQRDGPSDATDQTGDPTSGVQPTQKQQGADRPAESPNPGASPAGNTGSTSVGGSSSSSSSGGGGSGGSGKPAMPHTDSEREALMQKGEFPRDPDDHSGEPMHMHAGGAPADDEQPADEAKTDRSASVAQEGGGPHGKTLGTGQKYVRSTGMAADGGDFDATKPGAGAEATRLMEEAGIKTEGQTAPSQQKSDGKAGKDPAGAEKHGKLTKVKEKLHIGKAH